MSVNRRFLSQTLFATLFTVMVNLPVFAEQHPYSVTNETQLDGQTYRGYQMFRNWCARCHGTYGQGLAAPNLAISLNKMSKQGFMAVIVEDKITAHGMPGWSANPQVMAHREHLYRYLKARSDGAIGVLMPELAQ